MFAGKGVATVIGEGQKICMASPDIIQILILDLQSDSIPFEVFLRVIRIFSSDLDVGTEVALKHGPVVCMENIVRITGLRIIYICGHHCPELEGGID